MKSKNLKQGKATKEGNWKEWRLKLREEEAESLGRSIRFYYDHILDELIDSHKRLSTKSLTEERTNKLREEYRTIFEKTKSDVFSKYLRDLSK